MVLSSDKIETLAAGLTSVESLSPGAQKVAKARGVPAFDAKLVSVVQDVGKSKKAIEANEELSATGKRKRRKELLRKAMAEVLGAIAETASEVGERLEKALGAKLSVDNGGRLILADVARDPKVGSVNGSENPLSRLSPTNPLGADVMNRLQMARDEFTRMSGEEIVEAVQDAASEADSIIFYAIDSLPSPARKKTLNKAALTEESVDKSRAEFRRNADPVQAAFLEDVTAVARHISTNAKNAVQAVAQAAGVTQDTTKDLGHALRHLSPWLARADA